MTRTGVYSVCKNDTERYASPFCVRGTKYFINTYIYFECGANGNTNYVECDECVRVCACVRIMEAMM